MGRRESYKKGVFILGIIMIVIGVATTAFNFYNMKHMGYAAFDSQVGNLSASVQTYVACTWSSAALDVDFGSLLNPGENDIEATQNNIMAPGTGYNVTVDSLTTSDVNISVSGNDLVDGGNSIGIGNITWASGSTVDDAGMIAGSSTPITTSTENIASNVASSSTVYYRFWLDVPSTTVAGNYVGNYTIECQEA